MLALEKADVFYGKAQALHGVSLEFRPGEIVALIGRNGAGKSTTLKALCGLLPCAAGRRLLDNADASRADASTLSRRGVAYVPETRRIFPNLTVEENLRVAQASHPPGPWTLERVYDLFPALRERAGRGGDTLSGGEQQMLAIARAMVTNPRYLLLDEPTEGLAPLLVRIVADAIAGINREGVGVLLVEQNLKVPLRLAQRILAIENGGIVWRGDTAALLADRAAVERYIEV